MVEKCKGLAADNYLVFLGVSSRGGFDGRPAWSQSGHDRLSARHTSVAAAVIYFRMLDAVFRYTFGFHNEHYAV